LADVEWNNERANFPESPARVFDSSRQRGSSSRVEERKHREGDISAINRAIVPFPINFALFSQHLRRDQRNVAAR